MGSEKIGVEVGSNTGFRTVLLGCLILPCSGGEVAGAAAQDSHLVSLAEVGQEDELADRQ